MSESKRKENWSIKWSETSHAPVCVSDLSPTSYIWQARRWVSARDFFWGLVARPWCTFWWCYFLQNSGDERDGAGHFWKSPERYAVTGFFVPGVSHNSSVRNKVSRDINKMRKQIITLSLIYRPHITILFHLGTQSCSNTAVKVAEKFSDKFSSYILVALTRLWYHVKRKRK